MCVEEGVVGGDLWLGFFGLRFLIWDHWFYDLWLGTFRMGIFALDLSLGSFRLGS